MSYTFTGCLWGVDVEVEGTFCPGEAPTFDCPGFPPSFEVEKVVHAGEEVWPSEADLDELVEQAFADLGERG
jgi:hypothetical protein